MVLPRQLFINHVTADDSGRILSVEARGSSGNRYSFSTSEEYGISYFCPETKDSEDNLLPSNLPEPFNRVINSTIDMIKTEQRNRRLLDFPVISPSLRVSSVVLEESLEPFVRTDTSYGDAATFYRSGNSYFYCLDGDGDKITYGDIYTISKEAIPLKALCLLRMDRESIKLLGERDVVPVVYE